MRPLYYKLLWATVASVAVIAANTFDQDAILAVAFLSAYFIFRIELLQAAVAGSLAANFSMMEEFEADITEEETALSETDSPRSGLLDTHSFTRRLRDIEGSDQ